QARCDRSGYAHRRHREHRRRLHGRGYLRVPADQSDDLRHLHRHEPCHPRGGGNASLYYRWLQDHYLSAVPSPALTKAYMIAHTTYLTGYGANDTYPSNSQGYGMPSLEMALDGASRYLADQSVLLDNSGDTWTFTGSVVDTNKPVRIVMVYTDAPGA